LTVIGESAPLIREKAGAGALVSGGVALGIMSLFNGGGRMIWGTVSDKAGRKAALLGMGVLSAAACGLVLPGAETLGPLLAGICIVGFCYGGYLALMPSMTADFFGAKNIGTNYGILFTAWGAAGFVLPGYFAGIISTTKSYDHTFLSLAVISLVALAVAGLMRRPER
jgi:OFA family oxalate/formate antiporter-like MFS transporter